MFVYNLLSFELQLQKLAFNEIIAFKNFRCAVSQQLSLLLKIKLSVIDLIKKMNGCIFMGGCIIIKWKEIEK